MIAYMVNCVIVKETSSEPLCIIFTEDKDEYNCCIYSVISIIRNNMKKYISNQFKLSIVQFIKNRVPYPLEYEERGGVNSDPEAFILDFLDHLSLDIKLITNLPTFQTKFILSMEITN